MRRMLIIAGLLMSMITTSLGIAYACTCNSPGGGSCCGRICTLSGDDGTCTCSGRCE
jgi:hypothetical protein